MTSSVGFRRPRSIPPMYVRSTQTVLKAEAKVESAMGGVLPSRFPIHFNFSDYSDDELVDVLVRFAQADNRSAGPEALAEARSILSAKRHHPGFGNARDVRTLFASAKRHQISRLADDPTGADITAERVRTLLPDDFARAKV